MIGYACPKQWTNIRYTENKEVNPNFPKDKHDVVITCG